VCGETETVTEVMDTLPFLLKILKKLIQHYTTDPTVCIVNISLHHWSSVAMLTLTVMLRHIMQQVTSNCHLGLLYNAYCKVYCI